MCIKVCRGCMRIRAWDLLSPPVFSQRCEVSSVLPHISVGIKASFLIVLDAQIKSISKVGFFPS